LQSTLRRGWYWGSQDFREKLIKLKRKSVISGTNRNYRSSRQQRDYVLAEAERSVIEGLAKHGLGEKDLNRPKGSDSRKVAFSFLKNSELTLYQVIEWLFHFKCSHTFVNIIVDMYCSVLNSVAITCENAPLSP